MRACDEEAQDTMEGAMDRDDITMRLRFMREGIEREADTRMHRMNCSAAAVLDDVCDALELTEVQRMEVLGLPALAALGPRLRPPVLQVRGGSDQFAGYEKSHIRKWL